MVRFGILIFGILAMASSLPGGAQPYPAKPVRLINAFAPGGASDVVARSFAIKLTDYLGRQVTVENRVGAGGTTAAEQVAKGAKDGYTMLMMSNAHVVSPACTSRCAMTRSTISRWCRWWARPA